MLNFIVLNQGFKVKFCKKYDYMVKINSLCLCISVVRFTVSVFTAIVRWFKCLKEIGDLTYFIFDLIVVKFY